jgi:hypothetical protein
MKAISLKQPWAWLMVNGYKMPEFRNKCSSFRGECYIHASKTIDKKAFDWIASHLPKPYIQEFMPNGLPQLGMFNTGKIIGKLTIVDCYNIEFARYMYRNDIWLQVAGDDLGRYVFITKFPVSFPPHEQLPCKGTIFPLFFEPILPDMKALREGSHD